MAELDPAQLEQVTAAVAAQFAAAQPAVTPQPAAVAPQAVVPAGSFVTPQPQMQFMPAGQMAMATPPIQAVSFQIKIPLPDGSGDVPAQLHFGPEIAQSPQVLQNAVMAILSVWPLNIYENRDKGWGGGNDWNGGGRRRGGSYRRRY